MFTEQQRDWVQSFLSIAQSGGQDAPPPEDAENDTIEIGFESGDAPPDSETVGALGPIPSLPNPSDLTDMTSTCVFTNNSKEALTLISGASKPEHGNLTKNPDPVIDPGGHATWVVENTKLPKIIPIIGGLSASGCEGIVKYAFPDGKTTVALHYKATFSGNLPIVGDNNNTAETIIDGPKKAELDGFAQPASSGTGQYDFQVRAKGGGGGPVKPGPAAGTAASCLVTVVNSTKQPLTLAHQTNASGDFMTMPPAALAPGASAQFAFVQTPGGADPSCKGSCTYQAGDPMTASWEIGWENPVGAKNAATGALTPESAGFNSLEQAGQGDENVPFTFTLSGGGGGGNGPVPVIPPEKEDPPFTPPAAAAKEPTMRKGDKSPDGWVEYLQECLNIHGEHVTVDGDFGNGTLKAVKSFQTKNKLMVDGIVGNQTWAALRDGAPQPPQTDGRKPHTFEEAGKEARFSTERDPAIYNAQSDFLQMFITSVGDGVDLKGKAVTIRITPPGGKPRVAAAPLDNFGAQPGQGDIWSAVVEKMTATYPSIPPGAPGTEYLIEAYLDQELGGGHWTGKPVPN